MRLSSVLSRSLAALGAGLLVLTPLGSAMSALAAAAFLRRRHP
jgi:hypothetical protein